ncbi:MAG: DUF2029 domain-containing protein [Candidatus Omnitrophica bacterium]|nr:DUF2029 domain-containing protein [Candidatus Omnitrophota bacterium]
MRRLNPLKWPAGIWIGLIGIVFLLRFPLHFLNSDNIFLMDFEVYRTVAQRVALGEASTLYTPTSSVVMLFKYSPLWALLFLPLAWIPAHASAIVWMMLTVLWLCLLCYVAWQLCSTADFRPPGWIILAAVLLLVRSLSAEFLNGQVDLLWALLIGVFLFFSVQNKTVLAGLYLALGISLKLPALLFLVYALLRKQFRLAVTTSVWFLALNTAVCLILLPEKPWLLAKAWLDVLASSGPSRAFEIGNQSLLALAGRFLSADGYHLNILSLTRSSVTGIALIVFVFLFAIVILPRQSPLDEKRRSVFDGALLTILMVLGSPTVWVATYSVLLLPVILAIAYFIERRHRLWHSKIAIAFAAALILLSLMTHSSFWKAFGIRSFRTESYVFLVLMVLPWFGLVLFSFLYWLRFRKQRLTA